MRDIWRSIAPDNEPAADALLTRILEKAELAAEHPHMGSPRPALSPTARILIEGPLRRYLRTDALRHLYRRRGKWTS
ncbi:type II toxin-antitoxin system RelE/ParE family toxin [Rhizobium redzepovicii]|uniref:type II toxin-antitoxin system RelE/ParE family toxin n=1 Tax=Rhizobium redzepovicii TaxID=2867518 RepID=UPI002871780F|nr:type II toxin-antitoxin system RelE/ParE family toxin [Rhizobium redzepovicii]MDR9785367.1 type II toxin-antitoxin system RelE/ParE family toxin [Rhizobium redzepovicii]